MKTPALLVVFGVLLCLSGFAQKQNPQNPEEGMHAPDGGVIEQFNSILLPPVPHAPFSSTVTAEWTRVLEDGSTLTVQSRRLVVRDGEGRIYQERRKLIPQDATGEPDLQRIEVSDPLTHKKYFCQPATHACALEAYSGPAVAAAQPVGTEQDDYGALTREDLGKTSVNGVEAIGTRETRTLKPGAIGNDREIAIVKEIWYSPELGINVSVKRVDPRHGTQIINVTDIVQGEPDAKWFRVPAGYTVVDRQVNGAVRAQK